VFNPFLLDEIVFEYIKQHIPTGSFWGISWIHIYFLIALAVTTRFLDEKSKIKRRGN